MCGITGFYSFNNSTFHSLANVHQSNEKQSQRGPDSGNVYTDNRVALGHRRLSIIDTSNAATQPMHSKDGRYVIVFNGEIFNYQELSNKYLKKYWQDVGGPQTHSDTEVLLYLLIHYGVECLSWLHGFFAFSLYDTQRGNMILARDPFGKKPLLYFQTKDSFAFASEMKGLLAWDIPRKVDFTILYQYLQLNYVAQPHSMICGVQKFKPGHFMSIDAQGKIEYKAYYETTCQSSEYAKYSYEEAQKILIEKMDQSVQERMIADVPLGAFLSGGIDSSVIVALASQHTQKLNTFSIGYKDNKFFDETHYAQLVAKKYNTNHQVFSLSNNDFLEHVFGVLDYLDEPFADSSAIPVYILSLNTRKHVTVALSGDGADEVFSGYNKHAAEWKMRQNSLPKSIIKTTSDLWRILPHSRNNKITNIFRQLSRFAEGAKLSTSERYWRWASINSGTNAQQLLHASIQGQLDQNRFSQLKLDILSNIQSEDFNEILLSDVQLVLGSDMLVKVDMMSMANSLEVRSPFLAKDVVDFAFSLPSTYKIDGQMKKKIVQDAFRSYLPSELYNRPKHGFEIPLLNWFRNELWGLINGDLLEDKFIQEQQIFNTEAIKQLKQKLRSNNPEDSPATIWALIVFQYWWKKYIAS